jgi:iron complex outermembrane receptor protein
MKEFYAALSFIVLSFFAQEALAQLSISGKITDKSNKPVPGATVKLTEKGLVQITDQDGSFEFSGLAPGVYNLTASYIGYSTRNTKFNLLKDKTLLTISLEDQDNQLQGVEVTGRRERTYKNTSSFSGTRTETPIKLVPQAISYVTKEVILDRQGFKNNEVIKNISGVNQSSYNNNGFVVRGFATSNRLINGLRMGSSGWNQSSLPNMERIEVIKGPASALYANTSPGGTINSVTKKPLDESRKSINFATGSYNTYRIASDFTGPMNDSKTLLYRLNLAYQNAGSFRLLQEAQDVVVAPSISFLPNDKTLVNFDIVYSATNGRLDRGQPIFGAAAGTNLNSTPLSFAIGKQSDFQKEVHLYSTLSLQRKITDRISFNAAYMKYMYNENLMEHRTSNRYGSDADGKSIPTLMEMQTIKRITRNYTDNLNLYMASTLQTGSLEHQLLIGYDHIAYLSPIGNSNYNASGFRNAGGTGIVMKNGRPAAYDPKNKSAYMIKDNIPVPNVPYFDLQTPDYSITDIANYYNISSATAPNKYNVNGFYVQEQIKWGKFNALIALRQEYYQDLLDYQNPKEKKVKQHALLPRFGLVYTPVEPVSLYATYTEGYQPQAAATVGAPEIYGGPFDPLISNMVEGGAKMELLQKHLVVNLAIYQIIQNNVLVNANEPGNADMLRQIGQQRARGVELDVYGQINSNLSLTANFAYNKAIITKSTITTEIGGSFPNAPVTQGGLWAKYMFTNPVINGLGIGLGSNFAAKRMASGDGKLTLPAYLIFDAALYYSIDKFRLSGNLNNVLNTDHWIGGFDYNRLFPGTPRNFLIGIGYTF